MAGTSVETNHPGSRSQSVASPSSRVKKGHLALRFSFPHAATTQATSRFWAQMN